jgi:hypothetical protein
MKTYTYSYKSDSKNEAIGRITAQDIEEAQILIAQIKNLDMYSINTLFNIEEVTHETKQDKSKLF